MSDIGSGIDAPAIEQDPSIAQIQAQQVIPIDIITALPATGFVASINSLTGLIAIQAGTSSAGVMVVISGDGVSTITIGVTGIGGAGTAKSNIQAGAPTPSNDESEGYAIYSIWIDNTVPAAPTIYMCSSAATMAAIWTALN